MLDPKAGVLFEHGEDASEGPWVLRQFLDKRASSLFALPAAMASGAPMEGVFADWESKVGEAPVEFLHAFVNGRIAVVLACPDAERAQGEVTRPLRALLDRLFRLNPVWRLDEKGRGLFLSFLPALEVFWVGDLCYRSAAAIPSGYLAASALYAGVCSSVCLLLGLLAMP